MYAIDEDDSENFEEADNEEDLQAWCLLKKANQASPLSVENRQKIELEGNH